ncbi:MAG: hypothetical protein K2M17_04265 [Bacilli bacterium]|nr:hypothetical protein [Bacilli bacterium]
MKKIKNTYFGAVQMEREIDVPTTLYNFGDFYVMKEYGRGINTYIINCAPQQTLIKASENLQVLSLGGNTYAIVSSKNITFIYKGKIIQQFPCAANANPISLNDILLKKHLIVLYITGDDKQRKAILYNYEKNKIEFEADKDIKVMEDNTILLQNHEGVEKVPIALEGMPNMDVSLHNHREVASAVYPRKNERIYFYEENGFVIIDELDPKDSQKVISTKLVDIKGNVLLSTATSMQVKRFEPHVYYISTTTISILLEAREQDVYVIATLPGYSTFQGPMTTPFLQQHRLYIFPELYFSNMRAYGNTYMKKLVKLTQAGYDELANDFVCITEKDEHIYALRDINGENVVVEFDVEGQVIDSFILNRFDESQQLSRMKKD